MTKSFKILSIFLLFILSFSLILSSCKFVKNDTVTPDINNGGDSNIIPDNGNTNSSNNDNQVPDNGNPDSGNNDNEVPDEIIPVTVMELPEGHEFSRAKSKTTLIPKTVTITECYQYLGMYYYFVELDDDTNDRLYYRSDINYIADNKNEFLISVGDYKLYRIFDRSAINEYGYGFEPCGGSLVVLDSVKTDQYFEWNGSWYYYYDTVGDEVRFVKSDVPYHEQGMETFWLKGWADFYRFVQL